MTSNPVPLTKSLHRYYHGISSEHHLPVSYIVAVVIVLVHVLSNLLILAHPRHHLSACICPPCSALPTTEPPEDD